MTRDSAWVTAGDLSLFTDLYELAMVQAFWREGLLGRAVFSLFIRRLPVERSFLLAAGLEEAVRYLEDLHFTTDALDWLAGTQRFDDAFLRWLESFRFTGDVHALPEGTPFFAEEPLLEIEAPLPEAQLAETFLMNQVHLQTLLASKAVRVVHAARGRTVVDFGLRRIHGTDAGVKAARAFHIAGVHATSNVLAGRIWGVPIAGTMAHSYVQAHDTELDAFRAFAELYPETILLVDTYDTLDGVRRVVDLAKELGPAFRVQGIRLDSGDLLALSLGARRILDDAGLGKVEIFASGGLNEYIIDDLLRRGAPIDGFGVGTDMGVSRDVPSLDIVYKLTEYAGAGRLKLSPGKPVLPGRKQVFRIEHDGRAVRDIIARPDARVPGGRPLMIRVMANGARTTPPEPLQSIRDRARSEIARLPDSLHGLEPAGTAYTVEIADELIRHRDEVASRTR